MYHGLTIPYWLTLHGLVTVVAVLLYTITSHLLQQRRHPAAAIAWVLFILLMPYLALPAFLMFGSRKLARPSNLPRLEAPRAPSRGTWPVRTALALGQPAPAPYRDLHLHADGMQALTALWETIDGARQTIALCTFIIGRDAVGHALIDKLTAKARDGVQVRVLIDGLGSLMRTRPSLAPLRDAGVQVTLFVPPLHSPLKGRSNLRDHRKMVIADAAFESRRLWTGGRNFASEYFNGEPGRAPWNDLSFDLRGAFVTQAIDLFESDWAFANGRRREHLALTEVAGRTAAEGAAIDDAGGLRSIDGPAAACDSVSDAAVAGDERPALRGLRAGGSGVRGGADTGIDTGTGDDTGNAVPFDAPPGETCAQLIASGPDQVDDTVYSMLLTAAYRARRRIALITPYFVPDAALLAALGLAARRGVRVDLVLPQRSNHRMSDVARRRALRQLGAAGGRIWLTPHMLHAKLVLVDDALALAGSANIDSRSLFLNYELMVAFHDADAIGRFDAWFFREMALAERFTPRRAGLLADVSEGLVLWLGFQL